MNEHLMDAIVVQESGKKGDWNTLVLDRVPRPSPKAGEVLVRVEACSVNRADLLQRRGLYPPPPGASSIMGLDFAGEVVEKAPDVADWNPGERVFGIIAGGGYGRYRCGNGGNHLVAIPDNLDFVEAAAAAEVFFTAFFNLFLEARMKSGGNTAGSWRGQRGGNGSHPIGQGPRRDGHHHRQLPGKTRTAAWTWVQLLESTTRPRILQPASWKSPEARAWMSSWTGLAAPYLSKHIDILKPRGRLVIIGLMGGHKAEISLAPVF